MAGALKEKQLVQNAYASLQAVSCPLVDGLYLQETESMLQLLCAPSQLRTDILAWICSSINPNFCNSKAMSTSPKDPDVLTKEIALLGQDLMLCKADDLDLIKGDASHHRQLRFLEQLLSVVQEGKKSTGSTQDAEALLNEIFAAENRPHLTLMLKPTFNPWPQTLKKGTEPSSRPSKGEHADVSALLQQTQSALEQLQSQCEFLNSEAQSPGVFSPGVLRVAASDLQQLMATFSHVYQADLSAYCSRDPPSFSSDTDVFQRVHQLLLAFTTELEIIRELSEASVSMNEEVNKLQTQKCYWSRGEKHTLEEQMEELNRRIRDFFPLLPS